jgi:archaemetzincin
MLKGALNKIRYISLALLIALAVANAVFILNSREAPAATSTSPFAGSVIFVQPLGDVEPGKLSVLEDVIKDNFDMECRMLLAQKLQRAHYVRTREQYDAMKLMSRAKQHIPLDAFRYIVVLDEDIFSERCNFIFGQAQVPGKVCIVSLNRFADPERDLLPSEINLFKIRLTKLLLHELGHTFGLSHCRNEACVMHFANSMVELDNQSAHYCPECLERLRWVGILDILTDDGDAMTFLSNGTTNGESNGYTIR